MSIVIAKSLYETWAENITKNAQEVAKLYDSKAILLPTIRGDYLNNSADIERYFEAFCVLKPQATLIDGEYNAFNENNIIIFAGHYSFTFASQADAQGRFSFVFRTLSENPILGESAHIIHHHSSIQPEENL